MTPGHTFASSNKPGLAIYLVVLVEERSMKIVLESILPKVLPEGVKFYVVSYQGKSDLMNNMSTALKGWKDPEARFVIVRDQDRNDCHEVKADIAAEVTKTGKAALIRMVCRELESWYFGDLEAVSSAYGRDYTSVANKRAFRDPDAIHDVKKRFVSMVPGHQRISGATKIAPHLEVDRNRSQSFKAFVDGVRRLVSS